MTDILEKKFSASFSGQTVIACLAENTNFSKQQLKQFMQKGTVWLQTNQQQKPTRVRRAKKTLAIDDVLFFYFNTRILATTIPNPTLIADKVNFSVWYKPKGVLCQGSKWGDHTTINRWIETNYKFNNKTRPAIIVHRLDKATDGLILIAHNKQYAKKITQAFSSKNIVKIYQALVQGHFTSQITYQQPIDDKDATSHVSLINYDKEKNCSLLKIQIETGRKHQIRKHLSQAGFPIIGDRLYGETTVVDLQLTAIYLEIKLDNITYQFSLADNY